MKRFLGFAMLYITLSGCYQASLTPMMVAGPAAGATQGRLVSSLASTTFNYGVKEKTGKYPIQHLIKREKDKITKKAALVEKNLIETKNEFKNKIEESSKKIINIKKEKTKKIYISANKIKKITKETFSSNKPRYSYRSHK
tara:strand:- start:349 stop:771 length:423 start_codon:yes stop_codon:yes gene_type:complete